MAFKTITINLNSLPMANYDNAIAAKFGYTVNQLPGETVSQFGRRMWLFQIQEAVKDGLVNPAVDTARTDAINSVPTLT